MSTPLRITIHACDIAEVPADVLLLQVDAAIKQLGGASGDAVKRALRQDLGDEDWRTQFTMLENRVAALADSGRLQREGGVLTLGEWGPWSRWLVADVLLHTTDMAVFTHEQHADYLRRRLPMALRAAYGCRRVAMTLIGTGYRIQPPQLAVAAMAEAFLAVSYLGLEVCWAFLNPELAQHARVACELRGLPVRIADRGG